ncbi:MAG TPA: hypothetical protein P5056_02770 [Candidatus Paceibacterota bacterium]|nr:hypothetical protein [Candidatus Paceibacterota bacterium]
MDIVVSVNQVLNTMDKVILANCEVPKKVARRKKVHKYEKASYCSDVESKKRHIENSNRKAVLDQISDALDNRTPNPFYTMSEQVPIVTVTPAQIVLAIEPIDYLGNVDGDIITHNGMFVSASFGEEVSQSEIVANAPIEVTIGEDGQIASASFGIEPKETPATQQIGQVLIPAGDPNDFRQKQLQDMKPLYC